MDQPQHPQEKQNFKLVCCTDVSSCKESLKDEEFGVELQNSLKMVRTVEMYQWTEREVKKDRYP